MSSPPNQSKYRATRLWSAPSSSSSSRHPPGVGVVVAAEDGPDRVAERRRRAEHEHRHQPQRQHRQPQPAGQPTPPKPQPRAGPAAVRPSSRGSGTRVAISKSAISEPYWTETLLNL